MSGKPGRSGRARTPEERQAKRRYAKMGGDAAAGRHAGASHVKPAKVKCPAFTKSESRPEGSIDHTPALLAAFPELADYPFPVPDSLALKDALEAALKQAKAKQAEVELDEARIKRDLSRGRLYTADQIRARDQSSDAYILSRLSELTEAAVRMFPLESQAQARRDLNEAALRWRESIAAGIKGVREK
jgi:hypothetical protein